MNDLSDSRVLIVDDVKANVDVLVQALRDDYKLSVALNGESALRSAEKNPPDLVLLDILMPGLDGYEVCRRLRASPQTREVPVMFLSSLEDVVNKARGFEAGGNDYLTKPFEMLEVKARVHSLLRAKAYSDAVREKMASELRIAREIQLGILPSDVPARTRGTGLDIHAVLEPAREVGGDLYEVLRTGEDRVVVVVGDVSGKGVPAALFMAVTTTLIRAVATEVQRPEEILSRVNDALSTQNPRDMFVTLSCAVFEPRAARVSCASAGHPSPVLLRDGQAPSLPFPSAGMVAGIMPATEIPSQSLDLRAGDTLVFYTDGVTEAFNAQGEQFGERRLLEHLAKTPGHTAAETVASTLGAVRGHAGDHPQSDDITIVAVRYAPGQC
jgi:sigma-B regulation protein RsbU (phosphoserine phosphatase)